MGLSGRTFAVDEASMKRLVDRVRFQSSPPACPRVAHTPNAASIRPVCAALTSAASCDVPWGVVESQYLGQVAWYGSRSPMLAAHSSWVRLRPATAHTAVAQWCGSRSRTVNG